MFGVALSDILLERIGADNIRRGSKVAQIARRRGVQRSIDFRRIEDLPRRVWQDAEDLEELRQVLTEDLRPYRTDLFPEPSMILNRIQAAALREIHDCRGGFLPIPVGGGKALISLLAPVVLEAERPVLFVPADLREQTNRKVIPQMMRHFRLHPRLKVVGNSEVGLEKNAQMLWKLSPDVIIFDEVHQWKNKFAGRTTRMIRFLKERPETIVVAMSGTVSSRSLKDYHHIAQWCLGLLGCPLPQKFMDVCEWADAIDEGVPDQNRVAAGALEIFQEEGDNVRQGYRRRLTETPGVVAGGAEELGVSLRIRKLEPRMPAELSRMISDLRETWEDPNGDSVAEASEIWRLSRQLALGFWYEWVPPAPREWMEARKAWKQHVRETLRHNRRALDTELQVWNEAAKGGTLTEWCDWAAIKDTFKPNPVAQWLDFYIVDEVSRWLDKGPGIVWVEHVTVGERLSKDLGIPYFGAGKRASREILDASGPIVVSIAAHGQGKNLQQWHRNFITAPPSSGKTWEQKIGRTHRMGQLEDEVTFDVLLNDEALMSSFRQACADAVYLEDSLGGQQKLNYADIAFEV